MTLYRSFLERVAKPVVKHTLFRTVRPTAATHWLYNGAFELEFAAREGFELMRRLLVATPIFLSRCAVYGERISVDRVPYMMGPTRIELGNDIRISGQLNIYGSSKGSPILKIANGVYIGHGTSFAIADRIEVGDHVAIGGGCYIADTEGHNTYNPQRPIWEVPAGEDDVSPVIIEDNVQISRGCMILKGVRIGARSVIGAGAVVRSNIPPDSIVMGNPARVVKKMTAASATVTPIAPMAGDKEDKG